MGRKPTLSTACNKSFEWDVPSWLPPAPRASSKGFFQGLLPRASPKGFLLLDDPIEPRALPSLVTARIIVQTSPAISSHLSNRRLIQPDTP
jgi:hypothetical protein